MADCRQSEQGQRLAAIGRGCVKRRRRSWFLGWFRGAWMKRFVEGVERDQGGFFPMHLEDFVGEDNPVRVVDAFVDMLDLRDLGFTSVDPCATGGRVIIRLSCWSSTSTAISTVLHRAAAWNVRPGAMSS